MSGFQHDIAGGQGNLIIAALQSPDFVHGVSGWQVAKNGDAEFNNVETRGSFFGSEFIINDSGAFFYSGTPAAGNLIASIASAAGADEFGNSFGQGFNLYGPASSTATLVDSAGSPTLLFRPPGVVHQNVPAQVFGSSGNAGAVNESSWLILSSGKENSLADAGIQLFSEAADGSAGAEMIFEFGGTVVLTVAGAQITPAVPVIADAWHPVTLDSGWSSTVTPQYRLLPDGNVQVRGQISHAGTTALTNINGSNPLPAAYQPAATRVYRPPTAGDAAGTVAVTTGGVLQMRASGFTATQAFLDGEYSL